MKDKILLKKIIIAAIALAALLFMLFIPGLAITSAAETGACYNIADSDARSYCLARAHRDASICYNIKAAEVRTLCLADMKGR